MSHPALPFPSQAQLQTRLSIKAKSIREQWWAPFWRGLFVDPSGKHYEQMKSAIWLYGYLIVHADRKKGTLYRRLPTIAFDMGVKVRTIRYWLSVLRKGGYVRTALTGRAIQITIEKWKPIIKQSAVPDNYSKTEN
ncbi:MAG TPA: hypothetical protein VEF04_16110 [Blastocatellia bacterium]|nr:hypothetical protein [Blastocatellia bacterium]